MSSKHPSQSIEDGEVSHSLRHVVKAIWNALIDTKPALIAGYSLAGGSLLIDLSLTKGVEVALS